MTVLGKEITVWERAAAPGQASRKVFRDVSSVMELLSSGPVTPNCSYCRQVYSSNSCKSVTNPAERKQILRWTGRVLGTIPLVNAAQR